MWPGDLLEGTHGGRSVPALRELDGGTLNLLLDLY